MHEHARDDLRWFETIWNELERLGTKQNETIKSKVEQSATISDLWTHLSG